MYQALYRKWRPRSFGDVVGQQHITETLKNQVLSDAVSHAYLFIGTRGTGKTTCAKILAKAVNCESPVNGDPCNRCKSCLGIDDGTILDVEELDAASNNGVDNVRMLREEAIFSPVSVKKRVYIIDEVHMLSISAFNALLKILEEPPEHLVFILATTELHKVPATILSRCQRYSFKRLTPETVADRLRYVAQQENMELTDGAAAVLGRLAEGSMRDGLSMLDQCAGRGRIDEELVLSAMGLAGGMRTVELLDAVAANDTARALSCFEALWRDGKDPATLLDELCTLERDALIMAVAPKGGAALVSGAYDQSALKRFYQQLGADRLMADIEKIQDALGKLRNAQNPRTAAELCLISMCEPAIGGSLNELRARVERLEKGIVPRQPVAPVPTPVPAAPAASAVRESPAEIASEPAAFVPDEPETDDLPWDEPEAVAPVVTVVPVEAAPAAPDEPAAGLSDGTLWPDILAAVQREMPIGVYSMVSDSAGVFGVVSGDTLTVQFKTAFAKMMLDKPDLLDKLRVAAEHVTGRKMLVRTEEVRAEMTADKAEKLSGLAKFGVKFE